MSENQIREITSEEFHQMQSEFLHSDILKTNKKWGGCFIVENTFLQKRFWGFKKVTEWIAINDCLGEFIIRHFKSRRDAITWLLNNVKVGKFCRC